VRERFLEIEDPRAKNNQSYRLADLLRSCTKTWVRRFCGLFWPLFDSKIGGLYTFIDIEHLA